MDFMSVQDEYRIGTFVSNGLEQMMFSCDEISQRSGF
jgi:hypothetical protein